LSETFVSKLIGSDLGIFDDSDPRRQPVRATVVVDVTPLCCGSDDKQKLVRYAWRLDGVLIVQLLRCFFAGNPSGPRINFFIDRKERIRKWCKILATNPEFVNYCCNEWGVINIEDIKTLVETIFKNAPKEGKNDRG